MTRATGIKCKPSATYIKSCQVTLDYGRAYTNFLVAIKNRVYTWSSITFTEKQPIRKLGQKRITLLKVGLEEKRLKQL